MKKELQFDLYKYCWSCGLPQGDCTPVTHPIFKPGVIVDCPFDDLAALLIWHIIHTDDIWKKACSTFIGIKKDMPLANIVKWLKKEAQPHLFYNGLELVIWWWITYKNNSAN